MATSYIDSENDQVEVVPARPSIFFIFLLAFFPIFLFSESWAEKTLSEMTLDQKIGQIFMPPLCPLRGDDHLADWTYLSSRFHIGNAILKHSDPLTQVKLLNQLQDASKLPLLIAADAEWGLAMRMKDTIAFPKNRTLGSIENLDLIFDLGVEMGRQAKRVGIHMNLAPVSDVNTNPDNPIIGMRSFGEDPYRVAQYVSAIIQGMQSVGILACAKHFPGHGDTSIDSHRALPYVAHSRKRLEEVEFVPFKMAISNGVSSIMSAHLLVRAIDSERPATLSAPCLTGVLREDLHFDGLIVSDALNMKALSQTPEEIAVMAFQAGCDLLLYGDHLAPNIDKILQEDVPKAWAALKKGFEDGTLSLKQLDASVARILREKERLGLHFSAKVEVEGLLETLKTSEALSLKKRLFKEAISVQGELLPLPQKTAYLDIGGKDESSKEFDAVFSISPKLEVAERLRLVQELEEFDAVVIAIHHFMPQEENYGFSKDCIELVRSFPEGILCLFTTPYLAPMFSHPGPILIGFENDSDAQEAVCDILQGRESPKGLCQISEIFFEK